MRMRLCGIFRPSAVVLCLLERVSVPEVPSDIVSTNCYSSLRLLKTHPL